MSIRDYLTQAAQRAQAAADAGLDAAVEKAIGAICAGLTAGKPLLVCGNGGSAADAQHITGELVGRFLEERKALNAICLSANAAVLTAWANDYSYDTVFSRQVEAHGTAGAVLWGLSTSGNSGNVVNAFRVARDLGVTTVGMTGQGGGKMAEYSDILIAAPSRHTPHIQEIHLCLYHFMCQEIERRMLAV